MPQLINLPGTDGKPRETTFIDSPSEILEEALKEGLTYTSSGDNGAINIYLDDNGKFKIDQHKFRSTMDNKTLDTIQELQVVFVEWHELIQ